jgi:hypothetical protein
MRASFEFDLPDENEEYKMHVKAGDFHCAVWSFAEWIRGVCKHGNPDEYNAQKVRDKFYEFLSEYDVDL